MGILGFVIAFESFEIELFGDINVASVLITVIRSILFTPFETVKIYLKKMLK